MAPRTDSSTHERGASAERQVRRYFEDCGYRLVAANFRFRGGELDLIFVEERTGTLVFVEVRSASAASPWLRYSISPAKRRRLSGAVATFFHRHERYRGRACRFDFAWVEAGRVEHWKNVFVAVGG